MKLSLPKLKFKKSSFGDLVAPIRPHRDWTILLILFAILLLVDALGSVFLYKIQNSSSAEVVVEKPLTLNKEKLAKVVDVFQKKKSTFETLWNNKPEYPSPF